MKKDLAYYENGIREGSIIDLKGLKPGDKVYRVYDKCNGHNCPYNGYFGDDRCKGNPDTCKSYIEEMKFNYYLIPELDESIFVNYNKAVKVRDRINSK